MEKACEDGGEGAAGLQLPEAACFVTGDMMAPLTSFLLSQVHPLPQSLRSPGAATQDSSPKPMWLRSTLNAAVPNCDVLLYKTHTGFQRFGQKL